MSGLVSVVSDRLDTEPDTGGVVKRVVTIYPTDSKCEIASAAPLAHSLRQDRACNSLCDHCVRVRSP